MTARTLPVQPKILVGISILLLGLSVCFGFLNISKVRSLRGAVESASSARELAERARLANERKLKAQAKEVAAAANKATAAESKATEAGTELTKAQNEKAELASKLQKSEEQIADLQKRVAEAVSGAPAGKEGVAANEPSGAISDIKKQLDAAEQEKAVLGDKLRDAQDRVAALEEEKRRRAAKTSPGIHGTVLAVNQAYNFVVLGIGERQGVAPNSEMLVLRDGSLIGKIRISSVEPTTCIGDIIGSSLARGVQVLPGDTVVYAGTDNS